jgi:hypothetical protein
MTPATGPRRLTAFVDESYRAGFYLLSAAIVDTRSISWERLQTTLKTISHELPGHEIHASKMRSADDRRVLDQVERLVSASPAAALLVSVKAPIDRGQEQARQHCLADLAVELSRVDVQDLRLDTRRNPSRPGSAILDRLDLDTVRGLAAADRIHPDLRIRHTASTASPGIWIADVTGYAVNQTLAKDDPDRLKLLAWKLEIREARHLPSADRPGNPAVSRPSGLRLRLEEVRLVSEGMAATEDLHQAYAANDPELRQRAIERLDQVQAAHHTLDEEEKRWEDARGPLPPLADYLGT